MNVFTAQHRLFCQLDHVSSEAWSISTPSSHSPLTLVFSLWHRWSKASLLGTRLRDVVLIVMDKPGISCRHISNLICYIACDSRILALVCTGYDPYVRKTKR